jgi:hypothetical protein
MADVLSWLNFASPQETNFLGRRVGSVKNCSDLLAIPTKCGFVTLNKANRHSNLNQIHFYGLLWQNILIFITTNICSLIYLLIIIRVNEPALLPSSLVIFCKPTCTLEIFTLYALTSNVRRVPCHHGTSSGCRWRRRPSGMEGGCQYIE